MKTNKEKASTLLCSNILNRYESYCSNAFLNLSISKNYLIMGAFNISSKRENYWYFLNALINKEL